MFTPSWISSSPSDFVKAAEAGARLGVSISENQTRANLERERLAANRGGGGGFPRIYGGGVKLPVAEPIVNPNAPYIGGIPGSPMLVDPQRENQAPTVNKPFTLAGKQFISDASGDVVDYVAPVNTKTPFGGQQSGYWQLDPITGKATQIVPPVEKSWAEQKYSVPILQSKNGAIRTMQLTPSELDSKWEQLPEFAKTNTISQLVRNLGKDKAAAKPASPQPNGTRVRNKVTGETATWVNGKLVPDQAETETPVAEENPYAELGLPVSSGFLHMGNNYEVPAR